jgi:serine/threonine protein phosphatase PrpC
MLTRSDHDLRVELGFATEMGKRADNQDYVAACFGPRGPSSVQGVATVIADGVGGHKGGRVAAETAVRAFLEGYYAQPETLGVIRAAARSLEAVNSWITAQGRVDPALEGMATTFSTLILARRSAFILHVGDTRIYRLDSGGFEQLTKDHTVGRGDFAHALRRAIGFEEAILFDQASWGLSLHDRFLLCSDGVHGALSQSDLRGFLRERRSPQETSETIVEAALEAGSADNVTALVIDVVDLPPADARALSIAVAALPVRALPNVGETVDNFHMNSLLSEGRYSRLMRATDLQNGREIVVKFPHPSVAEDATYRLAFVNEAWVAARVRSPFIGEIVDIPPGRQTRLYSAMPFYEGEALEQRLRRAPKVGLAEGASIATRLARAIATLHRSGVIHRDVKPDNVILLRDGGLRLVDLGVSLAPHLNDFPDKHIPGTPSYMAPELFRGEPGDEGSDLYALGVTVYRMFCGAYPYGEIEPFSKPRFGKPQALTTRRPDLPAWLDAAVLKAVSVDADDRFADVLEFAFEVEHGAARAEPLTPPKKPIYERNPLLFWKLLCVTLTLALLASQFMCRH